MVRLTDKLLEILELKKEFWDGNELKCIAEAIAISESIIEPVAIDPTAITPAEILKEWMGD